MRKLSVTLLTHRTTPFNCNIKSSPELKRRNVVYKKAQTGTLSRGVSLAWSRCSSSNTRALDRVRDATDASGIWRSRLGIHGSLSWRRWPMRKHCGRPCSVGAVWQPPELSVMIKSSGNHDLEPHGNFPETFPRPVTCRMKFCRPAPKWESRRKIGVRHGAWKRGDSTLRPWCERPQRHAHVTIARKRS